MTTVLLISGSTRAASTNSAALRTVGILAPPGIEVEHYDGLVDLPAFIPGEDNLPAAVIALRERLSWADAVLLCTPEYAGTLPGSLKNLLDWTVGTGDLYGKPAAWITVAAPGRGEGAIATLSMVLGYVGAEVDRENCPRLPVPRDGIGDDGLVTSTEFRTGALAALNKLVRQSVRVVG
ncbi:NADPH-dependent FMN reductase [Nocardia callitridis]|uniref:NADPH-dependent FMN reductase n=1 Tax=Nocardia callitridis TaxID=648753 RepID=A0ABP9JW82_9NOCA